MQKLLKMEIIRFCIVGGIGFVINFALLTLTYKKLHFPLFLAQLVSSEIALFSNFVFHHNWTYKANKVSRSVPSLLTKFHVTSWVAIVGSALMVSGGVKYLHMNYIVALIISSLIALGWNFGWTKFVIWKKDNVVAEAQGE